jgi:hypothetical protein
VQQLIVSGQDRQARHLELQRQGAGGWNPLSGAEQAAQDGPTESFVDLPVNRNAGGPVDREVGQEREAGGDLHRRHERKVVMAET